MWPRRLLIALGVLLNLVGLILLVWVLVAGPTTVARILRYGDTDIDDFSHYPGRRLSASRQPSEFSRDQMEIELPAIGIAGSGLEANELDQLLAANDSIAFLAIKDGVIRHEAYFQGHSESSLSQLFSVSKSITSLLIGIALDQGLMASVNEPVTRYVPELGASGFDEVQLSHLLTMTSGTDYQENDNPFGEHVILNFTPDLERRLLSIGMETEPGAVFRYKSGDNGLLALALTRALGDETITEFAQGRLWGPLGMAHEAVWTIDSEQGGLEKTWCCLAVSAPDLARIGQLFLNEGRWNDQQIVSSHWVQAASSPQVPEAIWPAEYMEAGWRNYGYQWWLASEEDADIFALGKDGQFLYINPAHQVVIVRLGWSSGDLLSSQWIKLFQALARTLE